MPIHHNFDKMTKIRIKLNTGEVITDRYIETKANYLITENYKLKWKDIKSTTIYKNVRSIK